MKCECDKPYPPIQVEQENIDYAKMLLVDYAGEMGEDTAIHRYLYQSLINEEVSHILKGIAKVEMKHLDVLGELIQKLGYLPSFYTIDSNIGCVIPWTSNYVDYTIDLPTFLLNDIESEVKTIQQYQKQIEEIEDRYIQNILKRIIQDEEVHIQCLQTLYQKYC